MSISLSLLLIFFFRFVSAIGQERTISFNDSIHSLKLASRNSSARIVVDYGEWPAVLRAASDLALDFGRVSDINGTAFLTGKGTGIKATGATIFDVSNWPTWNNSTFDRGIGVIIAGTLKKSALVDGLVKDGKINVGPIQDQWEAFTSTIVSNPIAGVSRALVITGT
jgi:hypothetical protein